MTPLSRLKSMGLSTGLAGWLVMTAPRLLHAENAISYKYEDYREADGRIAVRTQGALFEQDFGPDLHLKLEGVIDAISGATPNGQPAPAGSDQVVLTELKKNRTAWNAEFSRQFPGLNLALGFARSHERDYVSTGWSANTLTAFNQKNTLLLAGIAGTDDQVKVFYQTPWAHKRTADVIVGLTQLLDPLTSVTFDLTAGRATGFLSSQYKLVQKNIEVAPGIFLPFTFAENRPDERTKWTAVASLNHAFTGLHGAVEAGYRFYHDTFGTNAHTLTLTWIQRVGEKFILQPELRLYDQSAASFYHYNLDQTSIMPVAGAPPTQGPFYSSDFRISALRTFACSLKAVWTATARLQFDVALGTYDMRGRDGVTPQSAYPRASVVTAGVKFLW